MNTRVALVIGLLLMLFPKVSYGEVWNLADDFSITQNPNGAWSFGWRSAPSQPMTLDTDHGAFPVYGCDVEAWWHDIGSGCPLVGHNPHDYDYLCHSEITFPAHAAWFHPGPAQQSVVRWTAPRSTQLEVAVGFTMLGTGSDVVRIYHNGSEVYSAPLSGVNDAADYAATLTVQAGDVIDCAVDPISFYCSSTRLELVLTATEPVPTAVDTWGRVKAAFR